MVRVDTRSRGENPPRLVLQGRIVDGEAIAARQGIDPHTGDRILLAYEPLSYSSPMWAEGSGIAGRRGPGGAVDSTHPRPALGHRCLPIA